MRFPRNGIARPPELHAVGKADLIAFGRPFIANPDLVERLRIGAPLAEINPATLYGGGAAGYTDYPRFTEASGNGGTQDHTSVRPL